MGFIQTTEQLTAASGFDSGGDRHDDDVGHAHRPRMIAQRVGHDVPHDAQHSAGRRRLLLRGPRLPASARACRGRPWPHATGATGSTAVRTPIALFMVLLCLLIGGCTAKDSPEARFDDYQDRLARTLEVVRPIAVAPSAQLYPGKRELQLALETPRTGWIGLFQLHRCGLVNLVSERNSILGRVAPAHQRLAYESKLLAGLQSCRTDTADDKTADDDFKARLNELIAIKEQAVPAIFWNYTLGGDASAHLFSLAGRPPTATPTAAGRDSRAALEDLSSAGRRLADGETLDADELAAIYQRLESSTYGGQLQSAAISATAALDAARAMIDRRLARRPVCFNGRPSRRGRTLQTILLQVYGPGVQAYLADLVRAGREWRAAVATLVDVQRVPLPQTWTAYQQATLAPDSGVWARLDTAIHRHTKRWQDMLGDCGLMPGQAQTRSGP